MWISSPALAQTRRADPVVAAQQAMARLDYAQAYRFALEALRSDPKNLEVRRIAARSAKEMQRPSDCLRLMQPVPASAANIDDVGLVGDCASSSQFTSWSLAFLQQSTLQTANADMANFWLGKFYYRRGDYARADGFLAKVTVLPARLEKDRQFMIERSREVLKAQRAQTSTTDGNPSGDSPRDSSRPEQRDVTRALPRDSSAEGRPPAAGAATSQTLSAARKVALRHSSPEGTFVRPVAEARAGFGLYKGTITNLSPEAQEGYDKAIVSGKPEQAVPAIKEQRADLNDVSVDAVVGGAFGFQSALSPGGGQWRIGVDVRVGATQSGRELPVYALLGDSLPAQYSVRTPHGGWGLSIAPLMDLATNRNFSLGAKVLVGTSAARRASRLARTEGSGYARVEFDQIDVRTGGSFGWLLGSDNKQGAQVMSFDFDGRVVRYRLLGFGAPEGYPLFRYSRLVPTGSNAVSLFTQLEGDFLELNIAPRVFVGEQFSALFWYRYVAASRQSFVGKNLFDAVEAQGKSKGNWDPPRPTAEYTSASQDVVFEIEWWPQSWVSSAAGVLVRKSVTQYNDKTTLVSPNGIDSFSYAGLLDRAGESWSRYFIEVRAAL